MTEHSHEVKGSSRLAGRLKLAVMLSICCMSLSRMTAYSCAPFSLVASFSQSVLPQRNPVHRVHEWLVSFSASSCGVRVLGGTCQVLFL